jgi:coenzyme F420-reducing hydrogenase delta subunit
MGVRGLRQLCDGLPAGGGLPASEAVWMSVRPEFVPEITAFSCSYCGYMAADTAGALHQEYPANVKLVRLPCTGKTDVQYLLDAFEGGADAVYVIACSLGNCHHVHGNERGKARVERAKAILKCIGLEPERLEMYFLSGGMGASFAEIARTMNERAVQLGPNPLRRPAPAAAPAGD